MSTQQKLIQIRSRKLGLLLADARQSAGKSIEQAARAMGVTVEQAQAYESGAKAPSLPEMEGLAFYLDLPLEHFWGSTARANQAGSEPLANMEQLTRLRQRMIAMSIRMARSKLNLSLSELSEKISLPETTLRQYENGEIAIPLPELEALAASLGLQVEEFFDERGPVGQWRREKASVQKFLELPPELQAFVCAPVNRPYIQLAIRLSELNADKLRAVAEGLLEITY